MLHDVFCGMHKAQNDNHVLIIHSRGNCKNIMEGIEGHWMGKAEDRAAWYALGEAYVQQWTAVG